MAPYLQTIKVSFADVLQTEDGIDTISFLEASRGVVGIFDLVDSTPLSKVKDDLNGNITKVQAHYDAAPEKSQTLEVLVENEMKEKKKDGTQALLWLTRGLAFTCQAFEHTQRDKGLELPAAFAKSYESTLKPHHNFIVKGIFSVAMKAVPSRSDLYSKLKEDKAGGPPASEEELDMELDKWLASLSQIITRIQTFYTANGYEKGL